MNKNEKRLLPVKIVKIEFDSPLNGIQLLAIHFLKGDDLVKRYLTADKIFEALAEYEDSHLEKDAKTGEMLKSYYTQGW